MVNQFQGLKHKNDISDGCFIKNTLAAVLGIDWKKKEQLSQLKAVIVFEKTDNSNSQGDYSGDGEKWLGDRYYKRNGKEGRIWAVRTVEDSAKSLAVTTGVDCH